MRLPPRSLDPVAGRDAAFHILRRSSSDPANAQTTIAVLFSMALVLPVEDLVVDGRIVRLGVLIARHAHLVYPLAKRQKEFTLDHVAEVHCSVPNMVFYIVEFVEERSPVGRDNPGVPAFVPR